MRFMDPNQTKIIELLREVHLIAIKEIERLNMRIAELENEKRQPVQAPVVKNTPMVSPTPASPSRVAPSTPNPLPRQPEMLTDHQVAEHIKMSVATVRRWRRLRQGPKFLKVGSAVRYRRADVEAWLSSCPGLR